MNRYLIVGGVAGGASAAARLRRMDEEGEILLFERGEEGYIHPCIAVLVSESEANSEFFKLHEQKTGKKANIPLPVIIICLLACIAIALKFRRR